VGLVVETWGSGAGGLMDPICTEFPSYSNLYMEMPDGETFKYTKDHSKYAVSLDSSSPFVCFSDMNR
jgi:deoxyribonuclease-2